MPNEMLQSHTADHPMAPRGRDTEHNNLVIILINLLPLAIWMACQTKCYNHIPLINPWHREEET